MPTDLILAYFQDSNMTLILPHLRHAVDDAGGVVAARVPVLDELEDVSHALGLVLHLGPNLVV